LLPDRKNTIPPKTVVTLYHIPRL